MQTLGDYLKKAREARNISLSDIADYTKISKTYLDGLENDDYTNMPAELYIKGYISSYASCIGIDEHEALKLYDSFHNETGDAEEIKSAIQPDKKYSIPLFFRINKKTWFVSAFCTLIVLSIGSYYAFFQNQKKAAVKISLAVPNKTMQPVPTSMTVPDLPQKREDGNSLQPIIQAGFEEKLGSNEIGTKQGVGISQISHPLEIPHPEKISKNTVPHGPNNGYTAVNNLSDAAIGLIHFENNLKIIEAGACSSIENRIPQGFADSFEWSKDRIYVWTRINCERPPSSIRHIYYFKGEAVNDIGLTIRSSHWRTWSYKTLSNKYYIGPWRVDITSADGELLQSIHFEIN